MFLFLFQLSSVPQAIFFNSETCSAVGGLPQALFIKKSHSALGGLPQAPFLMKKEPQI